MSIKFKIDEQEYKLPEFISVENYSKIYKVKDLFSDDYFAAKIVSIVCEVPLEKLLNTDYQEVSFLASQILKNIPLEKPKFVDRFELNGVKYGFFPNWKELTFAEFIDLDTISTKKPDELLDLLHILAAIMYRPITEEKSQHDYKIEKYNVDSMKERSEIFKKHLDIKYVLGAQFFFINFANRFSNYSRLSLIPKMTMWMKIKILWKTRKWILATIFKRPMVGSLSSIKLQETILQSLTTYTKKR
jgi:hypothetical protein